MKFGTFLAIFISVLHIGHPLHCYKCNDCETTSTNKETCRDVDPESQTSACLMQKIRVGGLAGAMTIKKCVAYNKNESFKCQTLPSGDTVACDVCNTDYCNAGVRTTVNYMLYGAFIIFVFQVISNVGVVVI